MRGEGIFHEGSPGFSQWPANAKMLTERSEFRGPEFSQGDKYIYEMGQELEKPRGIEKTGNAETWLRAGINHHMTYVLYQIANQCDF